MDYERAYKEMKARVLEIGRGYVKGVDFSKPRQIAEYIDPELKESEDEKIIRTLKEIVNWGCAKNISVENNVELKDCLAWLEKQGERKTEIEYIYPKFRIGDAIEPIKPNGSYTPVRVLSVEKRTKSYYCESDDKKHFSSIPIRCEDEYKLVEQKPDDKAEPKFKVGDWIVYSRNDSSREILYVYDIRDGRYYFNDNVHFSWSVKECDEKSHLWTIQDAKDGDVLVNDNDIFVFDGTLEENMFPFAYCGIINGDFRIYDRKLPFTHNKNIYPATKEQRDLLSQKMKEAGYECDAEKKELKKIEQKSTNWSKEDEEMINFMIEFIESLCWRKDLTQRKDNVLSWLKSLKDRVQPKQEWSEEDYLHLKNAILAAEKEWGTKSYTSKWLKSLKDRVQPKQEWNEDDEEKFRDVIRLVEQGATVQSIRDHYTNWLKSLKDRVQPKQEWSEEDERHRKRIIERLEDIRKSKEDNIDIASVILSEINWFKSLKPHWKPSEEQMNALRWVLNNIPYNKHKEAISKLVDELKSL